MERFNSCPTCTKILWNQGFCSVECEEEFKRQVDQANSTVNYKGGDKTSTLKDIIDNNLGVVKINGERFKIKMIEEFPMDSRQEITLINENGQETIIEYQPNKFF